jgi:hypothetical protein
MEKLKLNLVGDSFTHLSGGNKGYSVHGKESKYIEWVRDDGLNITFYIDSFISQGLVDNISGIKYGWLLESKFITPAIVEDVKLNYQKYFEVFKYIFTHNKELLNLDERFKWCPANGFWIKDPKIYPKSKMISFITSNKNFTEGHNKRIQWVQMIGDQVDLYGRGYNEIELKEDGLCDYMFSVVIENGFYKSYFTEKILDCFATGTIPVYLGSPDIGDYFNKDGIIDLTEEFDVSEDLYYSKIDAIKDNLERVKDIEVLEDFIYQNYLKNDII